MRRPEPVTHNRNRLALVRLLSRASIPLAPIAPALAAGRSSAQPWLEPLPSHAAWTLLAGLGLVAVAIAALSVRRPRQGHDDDDRAMPTRDRDVRVASHATHEDSNAVPAAQPPQAIATDAGSRDAPAATVERPGHEAEGKAVDANPTSPSSDATTIVTAPPTRRPPPSDAAPVAPRAVKVSPPENGSQLFLALHHVDLSIEVLRNHLEREPRPMPAVWLMLLDLCRTHGREQAFCEIAVAFHERFNVRTPAWEGFPPGREEPGLEAYPRLVKEITLTWGTHECARLLDRLLYDTRNGDRKGFTLNAYNDLIALRRAADAILATIEQDLTEEARVRSAFDSATAAVESEPDALAHTDRSPLVQDLESQLEGDLRGHGGLRSAIEREHPALAGMLAREWGNAALSARLCEMLARGGDGMHPLSREAAEELALLRTMAERLSASTGVPIPGAAVAQAS
jgi:hypothetical protein